MFQALKNLFLGNTLLVTFVGLGYLAGNFLELFVKDQHPILVLLLSVLIGAVIACVILLGGMLGSLITQGRDVK